MPSSSTVIICLSSVFLRLTLLSIGVSEYLTTRIEVTTLSNGLPSIKEGAHFVNNNVSPYDGSSSRATPISIQLYQLTSVWPAVHQDAPHCLLLAIIDVLAAVLLRNLSKLACTRGAPPTEQSKAVVSPDLLMAMYLFNPLSLMSSAAGTSTPLENCCILLALHAACKGYLVMTAVSLAAATYFGLYPILLLVPLTVLIKCGPDQTSATQKLKPGAGVKVRSEGGAIQSSRLQRELAADLQSSSARNRRSSTSVVFLALLLCLATIISFLALLALSDLILQDFPSEQCLPMLMRQIPALNLNLSGLMHTCSTLPSAVQSSCWAFSVYRLPLLFEDLTPNLGQWWYFFAQMFPDQRLFFAFVANALCALFVVPSAIRFPSRGLLLATLQIGISCMLRAYPSVGDLGLYLSVLILLGPQLQFFKIGLFLANSLLLLSVLGPAMWHQWIDAESANSNFYYSITLLLGAWHVVFLVQILTSALKVEAALTSKVI
ncbi:hypothetical protein CEUSTIGMA_g7299.t1 [Chlamydomonas eustigma]|uniref:GPI transamidase subunit PIG-U n=1 Tax=Chlamydomonas eustigma TaxID=1157962 RepID=A0A250XAD7_9CHLO|nr:hypothetical protein CEUSTIGMA_g7299.t1 [Chlamydomonas eustigma]|eukprot:GAX79859.1 hypothetical protein CEUSTIGMA_g7299.t1 [Chlamydomonas eustigma]